jgi:hypothetical protein
MPCEPLPTPRFCQLSNVKKTPSLKTETTIYYQHMEKSHHTNFTGYLRINQFSWSHIQVPQSNHPHTLVTQLQSNDSDNPAPTPPECQCNHLSWHGEYERTSWMENCVMFFLIILQCILFTFCIIYFCSINVFAMNWYLYGPQIGVQNQKTKF